MGIFYKNLGKYEDIADSLRTTQIEMISRGYEPYDWARIYFNREIVAIERSCNWRKKTEVDNGQKRNNNSQRLKKISEHY